MSRRARRRQHPPQQILREQQRTNRQLVEPLRINGVTYPQARPVVDGSLALAEGMPPRSQLNALNAQQLGAGASQQWQNWPLNAAGKPIPEMPSEPHASPSTELFGASGTAIFSGIITTDEYNPDLLSPIDRSQIFDQMRRNHAPVSAMLRLLSLPILRADAKIEAGQDGDDEVASFVDTCLFHDLQYDTTEGATYRQTWDEILRHILLMYAFGFVGFELGYRVDDGWTKWSKWTPLLPRTIWRWWVGADNELAGIQQWTFRHWSYEFVNIPAWKTLIFTLNQEGANFEGISILRAAYKHWMYVQGFEKIDAIALERSAVVPPVIALPENYTGVDLQAAQTIVQNIRANEFLGVTIPNTWGFEYPRNQAKYAAQTQPAIQYGNAMILTAALADWVALGQGPGATGTYALADIKVKMFQEALQGDVCLIEQRVNTAIRRLVDYNFEDVEVYPTLKFGKIALSDVAGMAQSIQQLVQAQVLHPTPELEEALLDGLGLPKGQGIGSDITTTNPTDPNTPPQPQNPETAGQNEESDLTPTQPGAQVAAGGGEGATLSEAFVDADPAYGLSEGQLLTETLAAIRGVDVVERGMVFYNPNHDPHSGRFAPGGAGGAAEEGGSTGGGGRGSRSGGRSSGGGGGAGRARGGGKKAPVVSPPRGRASTKAERNDRMAAYHASHDQELGLKPGTSATLAQHGFFVHQNVSEDAPHSHVSYEIFREDNKSFRGQNTSGTGYEVGPPRTVYAPREVEHFASLVAAHAGAITPRTAKGQDALTAERAQHGNDHIARIISPDGFRAARDELAGLSGGGRSKQSAQDRHDANSARPGQPRGAGKAARGAKADEVVTAGSKGKGGSEPKPLPGAEHVKVDPFGNPADTRVLTSLYGAHQLPSLLQGYSHTALRAEAKRLGITAGRTKAETISRISAHVAEHGPNPHATGSPITARTGARTRTSGSSGKAEGSATAAGKGSRAKVAPSHEEQVARAREGVRRAEDAYRQEFERRNSVHAPAARIPLDINKPIGNYAEANHLRAARTRLKNLQAKGGDNA